MSSPLGRLLVAATERGICAVKIGASEAELTSDLRAQFPEAQIGPDNPMLNERVGTMLRHLAGELPHLDLPLDIRATAFQRQVWEHLQAIPYGETRTYHQITRELG